MGEQTCNLPVLSSRITDETGNSECDHGPVRAYWQLARVTAICIHVYMCTHDIVACHPEVEINAQTAAPNASEKPSLCSDLVSSRTNGME
jgi:hypothetical protein